MTDRRRMARGLTIWAWALAGAAVVLLGLRVERGRAEAASGSRDGAEAVSPAGFKLGSGLGGQVTFLQHCAACHADQGASGEGRAPTLTTLQRLPPERIYSALTDGKMKPIGDSLVDRERRAVAEWLGGRPLGAGDAGDVRKMAGRCPADRQIHLSGGGWNGWGVNPQNHRFQPSPGLTAAEIPRLKLKWAFTFPGGAESYSQPAVVDGGVFVGGDNGYVYALDAATGCVHWSFPARAGVRNAPSLGLESGRTALYFGDMKGWVYALDAATGVKIWDVRIDDQPMVKVTGAPLLYAGRLYVGTTTGEEVTAASPTYPCCRTRGTVSALDASTGRVVWKTYMTGAPKPVGKNEAGVTMWAPAGVGVWSTPTVDPKRGLLYVGTGDAYTEPAAALSDSIVALDLATGAVRWSHQDTQNDAWLAGCMPGKPGGNCPKDVGPDWDFGSSPILIRRGDREEVVGAHKGGFVVAVDPDARGRVLWRDNLALKAPGAGGEIVFGGATDGDRLYYGLNSGDLVALSARTGNALWRTSIPPRRDNRVGVSSAITVMPGVVLTGAWDGVLRAFDANKGVLLWSFDMVRSFKGVNGVVGKGGSMGAPGPVAAGGMVFAPSGYIGVGNGIPGNVLLAFAPG